ncbi:glycosyltransferase family 4 protein [Winogradskyella bathintestinalis]|uniref:Glycosyltransferase family 4 protein n=1 Tax=Winogradskyella bathintestinalis TaxID=3035208 RepID=A0ABT7ZTT2_9FLAO|nr:glycosyltransferase family 4 protein [Winogradskyella bathintestinalis]MDN3492432.1 glycosyltransferase family 4 protein [Winogradskyella bathintestinalis]
MNKLLVITHDTTRTGAPMVVLHFLRWLKVHHSNITVDVLALKGGNMEEDFKANCSSYYNYALETKSGALYYLERVLNKIHIRSPRNRKDVILTNIANRQYDIIYANTILSIPIAIRLKSLYSKSKVISHVHELEVVIKSYLPNLNVYLPHITQIIVPAKIVKENLIKNWDVNENIINVVYECAQIEVPLKLQPKKELSNFVVGASGTVHWRKGYDIFLLVASHIKEHYPEAKIIFQWVGRLSRKSQHIIEEDIRKLRLEDCVNFIGEVNSTSIYFNDFDVFLMPSREDPFPLVCIEVGLLGKPIISFDQAVGTNEVLEQGGGFIVPYLDIKAMAEKIMIYFHQRVLIKEHGNINKEEFGKFTPKHICPQLYNIIETELHGT